jgi:hypothetical protein
MAHDEGAWRLARKDTLRYSTRLGHVTVEISEYTTHFSDALYPAIH